MCWKLAPEASSTGFVRYCNKASLREAREAAHAIQEFGHYITINRAFVPNYGDRYRHGEAISTAFRGIDRESGRQQANGQTTADEMGRRKGAHLLLQIRTRALNGDLRGTFYLSLSEIASGLNIHD